MRHAEREERTFGEHLGQGMTVAEAPAATSQTAEGVKSAASILNLARRHRVEMPITDIVVAVINGTVTVTEAATLLMTRSPKPERYGS